MNRYFIYLAYNGAPFCGWQSQPNGASVQQSVELALSTILRKPITIVGAGRTDTGVHAKEMVAHFEVENPLYNFDYLCRKLNRFLPKEISIHRIIPVADGAHARFHALSRKYQYHLSQEKNPFRYPLHYYYPVKLDFDLMNKACQILFDYNDFTSFSKLHSDAKTNICHIYEANWKQVDDEWVFTICADRFLRNMVRAIVGTLIEVGRGKLTLEGFRQIIEAKDRCAAGSSVPGNGLYLIEVTYPEDVFITQTEK